MVKTITSDPDLKSAVAASSPLFLGIDPKEATKILDRFERTAYRAGTRIVTEGLNGSEFFLIAVGRAMVVKGGFPVGALQPGDFFGEIAILSSGERLASVVADTDLTCLVLSNGDLETVLLDEPRFSVNLMRALVARYAPQVIHT